MRPLRRWLALAVPVAVAALVAGCAPAASSAPSATAPHVKDVAAAAAHVKGVVEIHRGLVKDCEYISNTGVGGAEIAAHGPGNPVSLAYTGASCFNLMHEFHWEGYTGWQYQDLSGRCLYEKRGVISVGGPCSASDTGEDFFGVRYVKDVGWLVSNVFLGTGSYMYAPSCLTARVDMGLGTHPCAYWNF
jgi:hypothetical protein